MSIDPAQERNGLQMGISEFCGTKRLEKVDRGQGKIIGKTRE